MTEQQTDDFEVYNPCGNSLWCRLFHEPHLQVRNLKTGETSERYSNVYQFLLKEALDD